MLQQVRDTLKERYYDPTLHGIDLNARYAKYQAELKRSPTLGDAFRVIAAFLAGLNDSHTFFEPPQRSLDVHYGYRMQLVGGQAVITGVRPGSDAAAKLHPGDAVVTLEGYAVNRQDWWQLNYAINYLEPRAGLHFKVRSPDGAIRQVVIKANIVRHSRLTAGLNALINYSLDQSELDAKVYKLRTTTAGDVFVWKLPNFTFDPADADPARPRQEIPGAGAGFTRQPGRRGG